MMSSPSTQFISSRRIDVYEPFHQIAIWEDNFKSNWNFSTSAPIVAELEDASHGILGTPHKYDQEAIKHVDNKIRKRLVQNREAARKSRLRKKAYIQQLETCRLKLIQLEQELQRARQHGLYIGSALDANYLGVAGSVTSGIATFELEYGHWVEEQNRMICDLRIALNSHIGDTELRVLVDGIMSHYSELFSMKSTAAKVDAFYVMSGMWKTSAERFFLWIGGFCPSELLKMLAPQLEPLPEEQLFDVCNLKQSCEQAEDALSQGMDKLQKILSETVAASHLVEGTYMPQMVTAIEKLEALVCFVNQADHLRHQTLLRMYQILTTHQMGRCLLTLGEYFQRLRALSSFWANRHFEPAQA